jgi:hypothetical protein
MKIRQQKLTERTYLSVTSDSVNLQSHRFRLSQRDKKVEVARRWCVASRWTAERTTAGMAMSWTKRRARNV